MKLYAYCLAPEMEDSILASVRGIAGARPSMSSHGGISAIVGDLDTAYLPPTRENLFAHEHVVSAVLEKVTPLPFRFGMITSPEDLRGYIESHRSNLTRLLRHVARCVQMNVKVRVCPLPADNPSAKDVANERRQVWGPGTRFLAEKRLKLGADTENLRLAKEVSDWLSAKFSGMAKDSIVSTNPTLVVARFLVPRQKVEEFTATVESAQRSRPDLPFMRSGPWAPYHFAQLGS